MNRVLTSELVILICCICSSCISSQSYVYICRYVKNVGLGFVATVVSILVARDTMTFAATAISPREFETYDSSVILSFALHQETIVRFFRSARNVTHN